MSTEEASTQLLQGSASNDPLRVSVHRGAAVAGSPTVSVIIPVMRNVSMLLRCLRSMREHCAAIANHEVVVVANGTDASALTRVAELDDITLVTSPVNLGFGGGCNLAAQIARGQRLVFLNDDVVVTAGWLEGLDSALDVDDRCAVVGGRVLLANGLLQEAGCVVWNDGSTSGVGRGDDPTASAYQTRRAVDYVSFCSAMVRRVAWDEVGGFDERYFPAYYEDADLCLSLQRRGWRVLFEPSSVVSHAEGSSASRGYRDFISRRNQQQFVAKWGQELADFEAAPAAASERREAEERAVRRSAARSPAAAPTVVAPRPSAPEPAVEASRAARAMVEALRADAALKAEYIAMLEQRLSTQTVGDVLRRRVRQVLPARPTS